MTRYNCDGRKRKPRQKYEDDETNVVDGEDERKKNEIVWTKRKNEYMKILRKETTGVTWPGPSLITDIRDAFKTHTNIPISPI